MKYFKVKAKCGHVGKNHYILKSLYIKAENAKEAAKIARTTPRVKHHHRDAIREVKKISLEEYSLGIRANAIDPYFNVHNSTEQRKSNAVKAVEIMDEPIEIQYKKKRHGQYIRYESICKEYDKELRGGFKYDSIEY